MPDAPETIGELARWMERGFTDVKEDIQGLVLQLDRKVSAELYEVRHNQLIERVAKIEAERAKEAETRAADRRTMFTSVLAPLIVTFVISLAAIGLTLYVAFLKGPT